MTLLVLRDAQRVCFVVLITLLCLCVGMQILGLPVMMWNSSELDTSEENLDFSIPPVSPQLNLSILFAPSETNQQHLYLLLLPHAEFRPPKSPQ